MRNRRMGGAFAYLKTLIGKTETDQKTHSDDSSAPNVFGPLNFERADMTMGSPTPFPGSPDHLPTFSALNLLRNYNQFVSPTGSNLVHVYHQYACGEFSPENHHPRSFALSPVAGAFRPYSQFSAPATPSCPELKPGALPLTTAPVYARRSRGEKKPIPDDQKDDRYYERRKRNNQAAKKSRDARKFREDQIALRATLLEHENAILRAQLLTLREETQSLRHYILKQKTIGMPGKVLYDNPETQGKIDYDRKKMESPPSRFPR